MSLSATISLTPATAQINQPVIATLVITNSGSSAVSLLSVTPNIIYTGASEPYAAPANLGVVALGPGQVTLIGASGTLTLSFTSNIFAPSTGPLGAGFGTFSIGALCYTSDGSVFAPTAATVFVNPIALAAAEQ